MKSEVTFTKIRALLGNFKLEEIGSDVLVKKTYQIEKDVGTITTDFKRGSLIITHEHTLILELEKDEGHFYTMNVANV